MKCSYCEDELVCCEDCGGEFEKGDRIRCWTLGRHFHKDCMLPAPATAKENKE